MISALSIFKRLTASKPPRADWQTATDEELALAARSHDRPGKEAFVEIARRHQTPVCAVAFSVTGRIGLTDDIAQETFLKAWKRLGTLREPAKLKAWLTRIAHDCAVDALRREKPHMSLEEPAREFISSDSPPDISAADTEDEQLVWSALAELPEAVRTPLVLFYREGQSVAAVAAAMDLSEDAVKQRLSRGRNELRDQVTAKIEGVLSRVRPSALLIVSIATAIGLLTAPAVLAASAVSTAAASAGAATTGSSAATASTFSTAMTASSYIVATVTMAAFIPLGWKAREAQQPPSAPPAKSVSAVSLQSADPMAAFSNSALLAEWRHLHEVHGTDAAAMPELYKSIADIKNPFHRRAFRSALLAEWAAIDPAGAFQNLRTQKQGDHAEQLMREWLKLDPAASAAYLSANTKGFEGYAAGLLGEIAKVAPQELVAVTQQLKAPNRWDTRITDAFATYALKGVAAARAAAESVTGPGRVQALAGVAAGWAESNGAGALKWSHALPEGPERDAALQSSLVGWAKTDPMAALDHAAEAPPGGEELSVGLDTVSKLLHAAVEKDFDGTLAWLEKNPGKVGNDSWYGLTGVGDRLAGDPAGTLAFLSTAPQSLKAGLKTAWDSIILNDGYASKDAIKEWLDQQPNGPFVDEIRTSLLHAAAWKEPAVALEWLKQSPSADLSDGSLLRQYVNTLLNDGYNAEHIDDLLKQVPERMRAQTLEAAFQSESDWKDGDIQPWLARVKELPEEGRGAALASIARRMAANDPEGALSWVSSYPFPDEKSRASALNSAVSRWANADSYAASQWVSALPQGSQRNTAAMALITSIAQGDPAGAWTWAESLGDGGKVGAMISIVNQVKSVDPRLTQQLIENAHVDAESRALLLRLVGNPGGNGTTTPRLK